MSELQTIPGLSPGRALILSTVGQCSYTSVLPASLTCRHLPLEQVHTIRLIQGVTESSTFIDTHTIWGTYVELCSLFPLNLDCNVLIVTRR